MANKPYIRKQERRELLWMGSSLKDLSAFEDDLKRHFGFQLNLIQRGDTPTSAKPSEVPGVMKLVHDFDGDTYRVAYTVKLKTAVYVLHAFQKKAKSGLKTPQPDINLIRKRLIAAGLEDREREERQKKAAEKGRRKGHRK
jgi:phage-related protein